MTDATTGRGAQKGVGASATATGLSVLGSQAGSVLSLIHGDGGAALGVPKPLSQPIVMVPKTRVAGTTHVPGIHAAAKGLCVGDELRFEREPGNGADEWAIKVFSPTGERLGYVSADVNEIPARLMDGGKRAFGRVTGVGEVGAWVRIGMEVLLDD